MNGFGHRAKGAVVCAAQRRSPKGRGAQRRAIPLSAEAGSGARTDTPLFSPSPKLRAQASCEIVRYLAEHS
ncbi:hypothetical protein D0B54_02555 [Solimonas sp. K1W22B-7]|nr:hypothetical protein D0B54_02555 [Solimonas sp. K1W22B-7]